MLYPLLTMPYGTSPDQLTANDRALALGRGLGLTLCAERIP
jgi:hypothetical protein